MKRIIFIGCLFFSTGTRAQDISFGKKMVDTLTSAYFWGRGYTKDGMVKAAEFLAGQFSSYGLQPMKGKSFFQHFSYPVNSFPGKMEVSINGKDLIAGKDFIVAPESGSIRASGELVKKDSVTFVNTEEKFIVHLEDKLTMDLAPEVASYAMVNVDRKSIQDDPGNFKVNIEHKFLKDFKASNVCGIVKGTVKPDSFILITAHYDHLGGLGKDTYFPGANDNASGVSLLLNLARYYAQHPQPYSIGSTLR